MGKNYSILFIRVLRPDEERAPRGSVREEARSRSHSAPPLGSASAPADDLHVPNPGTRGRYQHSWMTAIPPADSVAVYQKYIANAPDDSSGLTVMWHGVNREMEDEQLLEMLDGFGFLPLVDFVYLPLNFWLRNQDTARKKGNTREARLKNKGYAFVHLSESKKEAEFAHKVATLATQIGRTMYLTRAATQGVQSQLLQTIKVPKARSAFRGVIHVRVPDGLKTITRFSLWQLHQRKIYGESAKQPQPEPDSEEELDDAD